MKIDTQLVELTAKRLKFHLVLSTILCTLTAIWLLGSMIVEPSDGTDYPWLFFRLSVLYYMITRVRIWWNHG